MTKYPNLAELIKYHPYHISTFADFARVTQELLEAALRGEEELTQEEIRSIARYTGVPVGVLSCSKVIMLHKSNRRHGAMIEKLNSKLYEIWEWQKKGSHEAERYMKCHRGYFVNLELDFINRHEVAYCRYLGVKHGMNNALFFISCEQDKIHNKPRGVKKAAV